jgi:hypothetical protein
MNESEQNQDCCNLDMAPGIHGINYPQKFVRAPQSAHPTPAPQTGKRCNPQEIMDEVLHAR